MTQKTIHYKKRLLDTGMMQKDLLNTLICKGYSMDKQALSNLLYGLGTTKYQQAIREISDILGIPFLTVAGRDDA